MDERWKRFTRAKYDWQDSVVSSAAFTRHVHFVDLADSLFIRHYMTTQRENKKSLQQQNMWIGPPALRYARMASLRSGGRS
jgi:hypothetical protein